MPDDVERRILEDRDGPSEIHYLSLAAGGVLMALLGLGVIVQLAGLPAVAIPATAMTLFGVMAVVAGTLAGH